MRKRVVSGKVREEIREKVQREFLGCKALQDIHYYRYTKEIEWQTMSTAEVVRDIKKGAAKVKKKMKASALG